MAHQHTTRCYWDVETCGWVCRADAPADTPAEPRKEVRTPEQPAADREPAAATR